MTFFFDLRFTVVAMQPARRALALLDLPLKGSTSP